MVFIIVFIVAVVIWIIHSVVDNWCEDGFDRGLNFFLTVVIALVVSFATQLIFTAWANCKLGPGDYTYEVVESAEIMALKDSQNVYGAFYILGGSVGEDLCYYYAQNTENGITVNKISANECAIAYTEGTPRIEICKKIYKKKIWNRITLPEEFTVLYVPEGTVTTEFAVDME